MSVAPRDSYPGSVEAIARIICAYLTGSGEAKHGDHDNWLCPQDSDSANAMCNDMAEEIVAALPSAVAQAEKPCGESVAWQYRELPNGIWHHCDIVTDNPRLEYRALYTSPAPSSWQPIETAPKDGTWFVGLQDGETYPCEWREEQPDEGRSHKGWFDLFNSSFEEPTQWSPAGPAITSATLSEAGIIDWKMEAERTNRLLADAQRIIAEYKASMTAGAKADVAAHGLPGARGRAERVSGCVSLVEESACLIWAELCPGMVMGDDDLPHYEAAAKAVLALSAQRSSDRDAIAKVIYATWLDANFCTENHFQWFDAGKDNPESCVHYSNVAKAFKVADRILALSSTQSRTAED